MKTTEQAAVETRQERESLPRRLFSRQAAVPGLVAAVALIWIVFQFTADGIFLTDRNLVNLLRQTAVTAIVALGMLVVIAQGEIDLSVGSLVGLTVTATAIIENSTLVPFWVTILIILGIGIASGMWNAMWVGVLGIPSFVATLGGLLMLRGISLALSGGRTITGIRSQIRILGEGYITSGLLAAFLALGFVLALYPLLRIGSAPKEQRDRTLKKSGFLAALMIALSWTTLGYRGLPVPVAFLLVFAAILGWALDDTVWGRHVYAVGANRTASRVAGIRVRRHVIIGFVLVGALSAFAAIIFVGRLGAAPPEAGLFLELNAIAAVVIGGASLYGGTGRVSGTLLGALLTQSLLNGLSLMNVTTAYQYIASGVVLMFAVLIDAVSKRGGRLVVRL